MRLCLIGLDLNVTPLPIGDDTVGGFRGVLASRFGRWRAFGVEMLREFARRGACLGRTNKYRWYLRSMPDFVRLRHRYAEQRCAPCSVTCRLGEFDFADVFEAAVQ